MRSKFRLLRLLASIVIATAGICAALALDIDRLHSIYSRLADGRAESRFIAWSTLVANTQTLPEADKLTKVNDFFNRQIRFADDSEVWGQSDYWATPMETLAKGAGDCEDFVIAKYFTLLRTGLPVERLRLIYVRAKLGGPASSISQAHMVLAYYETPQADPLVLDNLINRIAPASQRPDLLPVFSFNSEFIFQANGDNSSTNTATRTGINRLSRWQNLLQRVHDEGLD